MHQILIDGAGGAVNPPTLLTLLTLPTLLTALTLLAPASPAPPTLLTLLTLWSFRNFRSFKSFGRFRSFRGFRGFKSLRSFRSFSGAAVPADPRVMSYGDQKEASPSLGGCDQRKCLHFRGLLGGPAEGCSTRIRMKPRLPRGLRTAKLSPFSWSPGRHSRVTSYGDQNEASPSLGGLRSAKLSPLSWAPGRHSRVTSYGDQNEASPPLEGCDL